MRIGAECAMRGINADPSLLPNVTLALNIISYNTSDEIVRGAMELLALQGRRHITGFLLGYRWRHALAAVAQTKSYHRPSLTLAGNVQVERIMHQGS